ncbi:MAG: deoxyribose-phosphate aldolase [Eudoraea sp.]|nr:deoxyribose-phosphate aldolase [Eudoraea sp.]NNJ40139.1 deoxyribose-phosphate aldolase [Eudoraea sp.]
MKKLILIFGIVILLACNERVKSPDVQALVDQAIEVSGGENYASMKVSFTFREKRYTGENTARGKKYSRFFLEDSLEILDILEGGTFQRQLDGKPISVQDSMATKYANSINSVHYFVRLPYGLNDPAVQKRYLGAADIDGTAYHKIEVTFKEQGGGDDFEDIYVYWLNKETLKPDYLAYEFHINGGGMRFRKALNERYVEGIRFVDYENYKPRTPDANVYELDERFEEGTLELLSRIELEDIRVTPGNYN